MRIGTREIDLEQRLPSHRIVHLVRPSRREGGGELREQAAGRPTSRIRIETFGVPAGDDPAVEAKRHRDRFDALERDLGVLGPRGRNLAIPNPTVGGEPGRHRRLGGWSILAIRDAGEGVGLRGAGHGSRRQQRQTREDRTSDHAGVGDTRGPQDPESRCGGSATSGVAVTPRFGS